jgi:siroheme synthase
VTPRVGEGERGSSWLAAVLAADTAAIYMGAGEAQAIAAALIAAGKAATTPVAVVENATLSGGSVKFGVLAELSRLAPAVPSGPTLILVGEVYEAAVQEAEAAQRCLTLPKISSL